VRSLRTLAATAAFVAVAAAGGLCPAADPPVVKDSLVLTDARIVEVPRAEKQADGSYKLVYEHGEVVLPGPLVRVAHIQSAGSYEPKNDTEKANLEKGLVPYEGDWIPKAERDAKIAKKAADAKKRVAEAKAHREWRNRYKVKTANFEFEYTIDPEVAKNYMDLMETYYSVFTKEFKVARPSKEKLLVCFYHDEETFHQVSGAGGGTLAYYKFAGKRELNFYFDRQRPDETTAVMFHEAQHFLSHLLNLKFHIPHNFSESFAEYYGGSTWDPVKKTMSLGGLQEGRLTEIQTDIAKGERPPLDKLLRNQLGYDDYTWGWSFVHFMMQTPKYAAKFKKFYVALPTAKDIVRTENSMGFLEVSGETIHAAFKKYMGIDDTRMLQAEWYEYIDGLKAGTIAGFEDAAFAALHTGRYIRGKRLLKEAIDKGSKNPLIYLRYGKLLSGAEAIDLFKKGLEFDPLNTQLYVALGREMRGLKGEENEKEGVRLILLAGDIDPDDPGVWMEVQDAMEREGPEAAPTGKEPEGGEGASGN
jgi:hypothetical protein